MKSSPPHGSGTVPRRGSIRARHRQRGSSTLEYVLVAIAMLLLFQLCGEWLRIAFYRSLIDDVTSRLAREVAQASAEWAATTPPPPLTTRVDACGDAVELLVADPVATFWLDFDGFGIATPELNNVPVPDADLRVSFISNAGFPFPGAGFPFPPTAGGCGTAQGDLVLVQVEALTLRPVTLRWFGGGTIRLVDQAWAVVP